MRKDLFGQFPYIETEDLIIRRMTEQDTDALFAVCSNRHVFQYIPEFLYTEDKEALGAFLSRLGQYFLERRWIIAGVCLRGRPDQVIGTAEMFDYCEDVNAVEIGYRLGESFWGRGIGGKVVRAMTGYLFEEIGINRIQATVFPENTRSKSILLKNGFQKEGLLRQASYWKGRGVVDLEMYSLLRSDVGLTKT